VFPPKELYLRTSVTFAAITLIMCWLGVNPVLAYPISVLAYPISVLAYPVSVLAYPVSVLAIFVRNSLENFY